MTLDEAILALNGPEDTSSAIPNSSTDTNPPSWLGDLFGGIVTGATTLGSAYLQGQNSNSLTAAQKAALLSQRTTTTTSSNNTLIIAAAALVGVLALVLFVRK